MKLIHLLALGLLSIPRTAATAPPTCTTHFFDWYVVDEKRTLEEFWQKKWTYRVDWGAFGITPNEIGNSVHYYEVQCRKIKEAGFDGIHYEWHGNNPKPQFIEAIRNTGVPMAMFYDMEIRFHSRARTGPFIVPTEEFAKEFISDVASFYGAVPKPLWLRDRNGKLPIVVYGYQFDHKVTDPALWERFYRLVIEGVEKTLGEPVVFHWTNTGSPQQMFGFQHFPQIQSYIFSGTGGQSQVNARSVTFVVHYDDLGVSFARKQERATRTIWNDIRYLQEALWLAKHSNPDLVFHYGWNELYEGEHILPDTLWGTWRYELAAAMVKDIKARAKNDLPRVLIIADDFLPALHNAPHEKTAHFRRAMALLTQLRSFVPQAEVALPGSGRKLTDYDIIFALNTAKNAEEETALASCKRRIVYASPDSDTPIIRAFTAQPRPALALPDLGPVNEYVVAQRKLDVPLTQFPFLSYRCRNNGDSIFHIRYQGVNAKGQEVAAWHESAPTDDRQTHGKWVDGRVNIADVAKQAAGEPLVRLTQIAIILDDLNTNGDFSLDVDDLRMTSATGEIGWKEEFDATQGWSVATSFQNAPNAAGRFSFTIAKEEGKTFARMTLKAVSSDDLPAPFDETTRQIVPLKPVRVLVTAELSGVKTPILLALDRRVLLNTYSPSDECWQKLAAEVLRLPLNRGVSFRPFVHHVTADGLTSVTQEALMVAQEEELPIDRIRLVAPPELDKSLRFTLPASARPMTLRVIQGKRTAIPMPDPGNRPPTVTLEPGEVVELRRVPETFNVGLRILDLEHSRPNGQKTPMAVAVWYPTETPPQPFTYRAEENVKSRLATNAPVALKSGPYPLVVFAHGAYGSGYNSAFFTEYLASHGYIVVAPDYDDMIPPGYTRQIAFSRIKGGNTGHQIRVVTIAGLFVADMNRSRDKFFTYLAEHRLPQTSFVVDEMLRLNKTHGSPLHGAINEHAIGICGHSLGGATTLGKIGGHPDPRFKDERLKAALIFSAPAYPWENTLKSIRMPIMVMAGDEDAPALGPELPRRILYEKANAPKFYLVLSHATHFAFANRGCGGLPTYQAVERQPQTKAICQYGLAFFDKFLRKSAPTVLNTMSPEWIYYAKEESPDQVSEWGKEPPPRRAGGPGGIRKEFRKGLR